MMRAATMAALAAAALLTGASHPLHRDSNRLVMVPVSVQGHVLNVSRFQITIGQWNACVADKACEDIAPKVKEPDVTPVTGVNWFDVQAFLKWYNARNSTGLRLPTAAEWAAFSERPQPPARRALFTDPRLAWAANYGQETAPAGPVRVQGSWPQTHRGIADIGGNVWEWTSSCIMSTDAAHCPAMRAMGAHEAVISVFVRNPEAGGCATGKPPAHIGFRVVANGS